MSLLLAEGHTFARRYPVAMVWSETRFARRRINARISLEAIVMNAAVGAILAGPKHFQKVLKELEQGG